MHSSNSTLSAYPNQTIWQCAISHIQSRRKTVGSPESIRLSRQNTIVSMVTNVLSPTNCDALQNQLIGCKSTKENNCQKELDLILVRFWRTYYVGRSISFRIVTSKNTVQNIFHLSRISSFRTTSSQTCVRLCNWLFAIEPAIFCYICV